MGGTTIIHFVIQVVHNEKGVKTTLSKSNQPFLQLPSIAIPGPLKSPTIEQQGGSETVGFQHRQMIVKHTHTHTQKHTHTQRLTHTHAHTARSNSNIKNILSRCTFTKKHFRTDFTYKMGVRTDFTYKMGAIL